MVKRLETAESLARFDITTRRHHHIICKRCNEIMDFQWQQLDETPLPDELGSWGLADDMNVVVYGICGPCLKKTDKTT